MSEEVLSENHIILKNKLLDTEVVGKIESCRIKSNFSNNEAKALTN